MRMPPCAFHHVTLTVCLPALSSFTRPHFLVLPWAPPLSTMYLPSTQRKEPSSAFSACRISIAGEARPVSDRCRRYGGS